MRSVLLAGLLLPLTLAFAAHAQDAVSSPVCGLINFAFCPQPAAPPPPLPDPNEPHAEQPRALPPHAEAPVRHKRTHRHAARATG